MSANNGYRCAVIPQRACGHSTLIFTLRGGHSPLLHIGHPLKNNGHRCAVIPQQFYCILQEFLPCGISKFTLNLMSHFFLLLACSRITSVNAAAFASPFHSTLTMRFDCDAKEKETRRQRKRKHAIEMNESSGTTFPNPPFLINKATQDLCIALFL